MSSAHPDFAHIDADQLTDQDLLELLRATAPEASRTLNGELLDVDSARGIARFRFEVVPAFCHSNGQICQGGFLT
ncbi:MAG TPA: hypothetical protein VK634_00655, partial [Reyranella sp.]|nr:hypothetical protein [Reyranella sp.]